MYCLNCGKELQKDERYCTNCGFLAEDVGENSGEQAPSPAPEYESGYQPGQTGYAYQPGQTNYGYQSGQTNYGYQQDQTGYAYQPGGAAGNTVKRGPSKKLIGILAAAAAVLVVLVAVGTCSRAAGNFLRRTFSSPEKYYQYVEKACLKDTAEMASEIYDNVLRKNLNASDRSVSGELTLQLEEEAQEQLEDLLYLDDMEWLNQVSVGTELSLKNRVFSGNVNASLGTEEVLTAGLIVDFDQEEGYAQVASLSEKYMGMEFKDAEDIFGLDWYIPRGDISDTFEMLEEIYEKCPDKKKVNKLLYRYFCTAISSIDDVERGKGTVRVSGVSQKCTTLEVTLDTKTVQKMLKSVLEQMENDKELQQIYEDLMSLEVMEYQYLFGDDFEDMIDDAKDEVRDIRLSDDLVMEVSVNGKGEVIGRQISMGDYWEIVYAMPESGKNFGYELSMLTYGTTLYLEGKGTIAGEKLSGTFEAGTESGGGNTGLQFEVEDLDKEAMKKGYLNGTVRIPLDEAYSLVEYEVGLPGSVFASYDLELTVQSKENSGEIACRLLYDGEEIAVLSGKASQGAGKKASAPSDSKVIWITEERDFYDWTDTIDEDRLLTSLEKAGVPEELIDELEYVLGYL